MAFNVLPKIDAFADDGSTRGRSSTVQESRKILGIENLDVAATWYASPCRSSHSVSLLARFSGAIRPTRRAHASGGAGVELRDDPANGDLPVAARGRGAREVWSGASASAGHDDSLLAVRRARDNLRRARP